MTNRASLFARSIQCLSSTVMVMIALMNPSIDASVAVISIANGSAVARCIYDCFFFSYGSKDWCGNFISSMSQDASQIRLLPWYFAASITVVYSAG